MKMQLSKKIIKMLSHKKMIWLIKQILKPKGGATMKK